MNTGQAILGALKEHLRDAGVRYGNDRRLRDWLESLAFDASELADRADTLTSQQRSRVRASLGRQAALITEYVRVREAKALQATFRAVLLGAIKTAIDLAA